MAQDPYRQAGQPGQLGQPGRNQAGPDFSAPNASGPQGFSIDPRDRPYQQARLPEVDSKPSSGWFGRIVIGGLVMVLCAGGVWYGATKARSRLSGEVPLIQADPSPVKVKPENPSGVSNEEAPPTYDRRAANSTEVEQLLPPPEAPMARPLPSAGPPPLPQAAPAPAAAASPPERLVEPLPPSTPPERAVASVGVAKSVPSAGPPAPLTRPLPQTMPVGEPLSKSSLVAPAQQAAIVPPPKSKSGSMRGPMRVQIAATMSPAAAQQEWHRLQHAHADLLGGLQPTVVKVEIAGKGTFYRVQAGPVDSKAAADKLCVALKKVSIGCIVVHP